MNNLGLDSAFPHLYESCQRINESEYTPGLTKRELFAAMAIQGLAISETNTQSQYAAIRAVEFADALIAELAK